MATSRLHSRRSAVQVQDIPLNILDFKIPTEIQGDFIRHTYFNTDCSPDKQSVQREEVWKRERILGQGSHGIIYLERCRKNGNKLRAVKGIKKYTRAGENESAHKRELEAVVGFSRPQYSHCFVRSDGWFEDEHSVFIILEYLELGDLQQYLNHPFSEYETREITKQVLEGLTYMHENAFIHRDLKPQNILVVAYSPDWHVKIADFGISKQQSDEDVRHTLEQGTIGFAAPEQLGICKGAFTYTCAVDMWSLGAVAYRMFTGTNAFEGLTELVEYVAGRLPFPIGNLKSQQMSATGLDFILKLMSPVMESRPAAMDAYRHRWFTRTNLPRGLDSRSAELDIKPKELDDISAVSAVWSDVFVPFKIPRKPVPRDAPKDQPNKPAITTRNSDSKKHFKSTVSEDESDDEPSSSERVPRSVPAGHKAEPRKTQSPMKNSGFEGDMPLEDDKEIYKTDEPDSTWALRKSQSEGAISKKRPELRKSVSSQGKLEKHGHYQRSSTSLRLKQSQQQLDPIPESRQHTATPPTSFTRPRSPLLPEAPMEVSRQSSRRLLQNVEQLSEDQPEEKEVVKVPSRLLLEIMEHLQNHEQQQETELPRRASHQQLNSDDEWGERELALRLSSRLLKTNEQVERERKLKRKERPESRGQQRERQLAYRSPFFLSDSERKATQRLERLIASEEKRDQWVNDLLAEEMKFMSKRRSQWVLQKRESEEVLSDDFAGEKKRAKWLLWLLEGKGQDRDVERVMSGDERKERAVVSKCLHHYFKEERERERMQLKYEMEEEERDEYRRPSTSHSRRDSSDRQRKPHRSSRETIRYEEEEAEIYDARGHRSGKITKTPPPVESWIQRPATSTRHKLTRKKSFWTNRDGVTAENREYSSSTEPPVSDLLSSVESTIKSLVLPPGPPPGSRGR